jgi:hypothetical protein
MMRMHAKMLVALAIAVGLQLLIESAGGWREVSFEAKCLVLECFPSAALHNRLVQEADRLRADQRDEIIARWEQKYRSARSPKATTTASTRP